MRARFRAPEHPGHPNHPHLDHMDLLGHHQGATGVQLAIPIFPGGMDGRFRTLAAFTMTYRRRYAEAPARQQDHHGSPSTAGSALISVLWCICAGAV